MSMLLYRSQAQLVKQAESIDRGKTGKYQLQDGDGAYAANAFGSRGR